MASRTFAVSTLVVLAMCAGVALIFSSSSMRPDTLELLSSSKKGLGLKNADVQLLQGAISSQQSDSKKSCVEMCTTDKCKAACGAKKDAAVAKKGKLGLSKGDEKLLQHAQKQQKLEFLKACVRHCNGDEKCKATCNAPKGKSAVKTNKRNGALKLPLSDMQLLKDAEKRQNKETREKKAMMKNDLAALGDHTTDMASANDDVNHQPAMDGDGDWAKGMRSNAMRQLGEEQEQAKETAKIAAENDADDTY